MSAPKEPGSSEYITYEVAIPADASDQHRALAGLASAFDWHIQEHTSLADANMSRPPTWEITDRRLYEASTELWGNICYGQTVIQVFAAQRHGLNRAHTVETLEYDAGKVVCGLAPQDDQGHRVIAERSTAPEDLVDLEAKVHQLWEDRDFPFALKIEKEVDGAGPGLLHWKLLPGAVTLERLAHYAQRRNYPNHKLHGALGKSLDVINVVAGLTTPAKLTSEIETEFIEYEEFARLLREAPLTGFAKQEIRRKLTNGILTQFQTGRPQSFGEIILEGAVELKNDKPICDKIALSSLAALAKTFEKPDPRNFLRGFS